MKWSDKLMIFLSGASTVVMVWGLASWVNVVMHNLDDCIYASWNLFKILGL